MARSKSAFRKYDDPVRTVKQAPAGGRRYRGRHWSNLRRNQLQEQPLCALCLAQGKLEPATVADHVVRHGGDRNLFFLGKLQSLCERCHNGEKQFQDLNGYGRGIGEDGWPIDRKHPVYGGFKHRSVGR